MEEEDKEPFLKNEAEAEDSVPLQYPGRTPRVRARSRTQRAAWRTRIALLSVACLAVLLLVVGSFVGGVFVGKTIVHNETGGSRPCPKCNHSVPTPGNGSAHGMTYNWGASVSIGGESMKVVDWLDANMTADNMMKNLLNLTAKPHIAGSDENKQLAEMIYEQWMGYGVFDEVKLVNYSVLLSYPDPDKPNRLQLFDISGDLVYQANTTMEPALTPGENDSTVVPPFNAYSGSGNASGLLVYVNYGTIDDFLYLTENLSLMLDGYICIARYGNIFRGDKAKLAQQFGCEGLIIYSDPEQYAPKDGPPVYPAGPSLPPGGVQRGSLLIPDGDPLTPGIPAIPGVYRRNYSEVIAQKAAPAIPVQPISYGDAMHFLSLLEMYEAPPSWQGQLNITYRILQVEENASNTTTYIEVNNYQVEKLIYDVTATIYGGVEPDRTVILGNHRDAWVFGAVDPNSGTAALIEIARAFSVLRSYDWRPGRTIILCSWDAEEYGLMGATEWVEDNAKLLGDHTVAYLNVDSGVSGSQFFTAAANPLLYETLFQAAQMVKCPNPGFDTVYDEWLHFTPENYNGTTKPSIGDLGSGSDFTMFLQGLGISCTSTGYSNRTGYAVYHSVHDNFYWMKHFGDPDFSHHLASGLVWVKTGILLATTPVLPYDPRDYAIALTRIYDGLVQQYGTILQQQNITLEYLSTSVADFTQASLALWDEIQQAIAANLTQHEKVVRIITNKLMNIERAFIHPEGLPGRPLFKHVVFAPSSVNTYAGSVFPGISDSIFNAIQYGGDWNEVRKQIDIVRISIRYATQIMNQPTLKYVPKIHIYM